MRHVEAQPQTSSRRLIGKAAIAFRGTLWRKKEESRLEIWRDHIGLRTAGRCRATLPSGKATSHATAADSHWRSFLGIASQRPPVRHRSDKRTDYAVSPRCAGSRNPSLAGILVSESKDFESGTCPFIGQPTSRQHLVVSVWGLPALERPP
jgi:hypothetical protein